MTTQGVPTLIKGIVFIDESVADMGTLLEGIPNHLEVIHLDSAQDGVTQISTALQSFSEIESVHIVSHGQPGEVWLGSTALSTNTLPYYQDALAEWREALTPTADILFYGCEVGLGPAGQAFVEYVSEWTEADIAASIDITGYDGDWDFELHTGSIEAISAFSTEAQASYSSNLNVITVTTTANNGAGSLRAAIAAASAGSTIRFATNLANKTIRLTSGEIFLGKDITLDATGVANLTISGNNTSRIFQVGTSQNTIKATFKGLTLINGNGQGAQVSGLGGAINSANFCTITLVNCRLNHNKAKRGGALQVGAGARVTIQNSSFDRNDGTLGSNGKSGGAISTNSAGGAGGPGFLVIENSRFTNNRGFNGGAVYNISMPVTAKNSVFLNNTAIGNGGGAIFSDGAGPGGPGTTNGGTVRIQNSWFEGNKTKGGGGALYIWGYGSDKLVLENSTLLRNTVSLSGKNLARGGGIEVNGGFVTIRNVGIANNVARTQGGGLWVQTGRAVNITNSTFSANRVVDDAGGAMFLNTSSAAPVNITNSTIVHNDAGRANGALWMNNNNKGSITLRNSIVAFNTASDQNQQQVGFTPRDGGGNIEFPAPTSSGKRVAAKSRIVDPQLGPLMKIGDDLVHPLLAGSPAVNTGVKNSFVPTQDQRLFKRDSKPDVGAFEKGGLPTTGGSGNDIIFGTSAGNNLLGQGGNDILIGLGGADTLDGGNGADRFVYTGRSQTKALSQSTLAALDKILGFDVVKGDRIQLDYDQNLLTAELPQGLFNAGLVGGASLEQALLMAYQDKNQVSSGAQPLGTNQAVIFRWGSRTYLSVNNNTAAFSKDADLVIDITGVNLVGSDAVAGVLVVSNYFA